MSEHEHQPVERHCDVVVVGGSAAGLASALQLGRQRRSVIIVDSGEPRNAPAAHMHSYLGHEGMSPPEFAAIGRDEVRSYGVEILEGRAVDVTRTKDDNFRVEIDSGHVVVARRVLAATGLIDELPDIDGVKEHWGGDVIHCPFCHGFEVRDLRIVQIVTHPMGLHPARLFRQLSDRFTMILHEGIDAAGSEVDALRSGGVKVVEGRVSRIVTGDEGRISAVALADGGLIEADVVVVGSRFKVRAEAFASLGLVPDEHPSGLGDFIEADENGETSVPGLYAAGNVVDPGQQVLHAAANGSRVGAMIAFSLADEDLDSPPRLSGGESDWDHRYSGDRMWSGNPNPSLVDELADVAVGRALDVGAGEGGDAIWLAEQGWAVTASDISRRALERIAAEAARRELQVETHQADANDLKPFDAGAFDLVSAHYVPIPRTPDGRGVRNLMDAVAPGGILLFVTHDPEPMRKPMGDDHRSHIDPDAFVRTGEVISELANSRGWEIVTYEKRPRPAGSRTAHADDIVLLCRRSVD